MMAHSPKSGPPSAFVKKKFYWNTAMTVCLHIVYGCFRATTAGLNLFYGDHMAHKA